VDSTSQCIGPNEPAFIAGLAVGLVGAVLLARGLVKLEPKLQGKRKLFMRRSLAWAAAEGAVFVGPMALTIGLYAWQHPDRQLCTSLVWPWYFLPPVVLVATGVVWGVCEAVLQRREGKQT
jgi:hypothetical protein